MIVDEVGKYLIEKVYGDLISSSGIDVNNYYAKDAVLNQKFCEEEEINATKNYKDVLLKGEHVIMRCDAMHIGEEITAHASGYVKLDEKFYQSNEMFVFKSGGDEPCILFQSSYFSPVEDPNWKPVVIPVAKPEVKEQKPPEPVIPDPIEVKSEGELMYNRTVLLSNLPFKFDHKDILKERLERYGIITKYFIAKGSVLAEFENPHNAVSVLQAGTFKWKGRDIKIKGMPQGFTFKK